MGKAAFLSLGICEYFLIILTEDEFVLCVESAIDTIRMGKYFLNCTPVGFILNRIKTPEKFSERFVADLEELLEIPCITMIKENPKVSKSYGEIEVSKPFLAYRKFRGSEFSNHISEIASWLQTDLPKADKKNTVELIQKLVQS
jgi:hypothetical protein